MQLLTNIQLIGYKFITSTIFFHLFLLVGGYLLYYIVVVFAIHWYESAMDLHVFPFLNPPSQNPQLLNTVENKFCII